MKTIEFAFVGLWVLLALALNAAAVVAYKAATSTVSTTKPTIHFAQSEATVPRSERAGFTVEVLRDGDATDADEAEIEVSGPAGEGRVGVSFAPQASSVRVKVPLPASVPRGGAKVTLRLANPQNAALGEPKELVLTL